MFHSGTNVFVVVVIGHRLHSVGTVQLNRNYHTAGTRGHCRMKAPRFTNDGVLPEKKMMKSRKAGFDTSVVH